MYFSDCKHPRIYSGQFKDSDLEDDRQPEIPI